MTSIGVEVTTQINSGPSTTGARSGRFHIAGLTETGPVGEARVVDSFAKYAVLYGARTSYSASMFDTARLYFEEGGSEVVVSRAVGPAATKGALTLKDTAEVNTVKIEAKDPGETSTRITVQVANAGATFTVTLRRDGVVITTYSNLASPLAFVQLAANNPYVTVTSLGSITAAPGDNPKTLAATALTAGTDDRAGVTTTHVIAALDAGTGAEGGSVAAPGYPAAVIGSALASHAARTGKVALLSLGTNLTVAEAIAAAADLTDLGDGDYAGVFYPSLTIPDGNATRTITPEGYIAAVRARAHEETGFWQVPAGDPAETRWVIGTTVPVDTATNNTLADSLVNGIVTTGPKVRLYGWQSLAVDRENLGLLSARDTLNNIALDVKEVLEPFVFATNDGRGHLRGYIESAVVGVLGPIANAGGFYARMNGDTWVDSGYDVTVDTALNPITLQAENKVVVGIEVRLSPTAQLIQVEIIKVPLAGTV